MASLRRPHLPQDVNLFADAVDAVCRTRSPSWSLSLVAHHEMNVIAGDGVVEDSEPVAFARPV